MKDGHFALLYYNNGRTDKVGYVGRLVVWLTLGRVEEEGDSQILRLYVFGPSGFKDYGSATLRCKI